MLKRMMWVPCVLVLLGGGNVAATQAASVTKVCGRHLDPSGGTLKATGVSCATAKTLHSKMAQQTTVPPWRLKLKGRTWACDYTSETRLICRSRGARVTVDVV